MRVTSAVRASRLHGPGALCPTGVFVVSARYRFSAAFRFSGSFPDRRPGSSKRLSTRPPTIGPVPKSPRLRDESPTNRAPAKRGTNACRLCTIYRVVKIFFFAFGHSVVCRRPVYTPPFFTPRPPVVIRSNPTIPFCRRPVAPSVEFLGQLLGPPATGAYLREGHEAPVLIHRTYTICLALL